MRSADKIPADWLPELRKKLWQTMADGPAKLKVGDQVLEHALFRDQVHVERWARSDAAGRRPGPWPLAVSLHGGGRNSGNWRNYGPTMRRMFSKHLDRFVLLAPTVLQKRYAEWAGNPLEEFYVTRAIESVKRSFEIDTNRVFIGGYSVGAYGAWHIGGHQADTFAGIVSGAGDILIGTARGETWGWGILGNLRRIPIAFAHGGKDKPAPPWSDKTANKILDDFAAKNPKRYPHNFQYLPNSGHGLPGNTIAAAVAFVAKNVRKPLPADLTWEPKRKFNRQFAWLAVDEPRIFTPIEARRDGNTIDPERVGIDGGLSLLLNKERVDLARPVEVRVDGKRVFHGIVPPSLSALAESIANRFDPHLLFTHRIDL